MAKKYEVDIFDLNQIKMLENQFSSLKKVLQSEDFMNFIGNKCMLELNRISNLKLDGFTESDMAMQEVNKYRTRHKLEVKKDSLRISNDTMANLDHLSAKTLANYPEGFSIAKAIEFGTGILGTPNDDPEWQTQVNTNRNYNKGWYYEKNGRLYWSNGFGGKFIYYTLKESVEKNIENWVIEYINLQIS